MQETPLVRCDPFSLTVYLNGVRKRFDRHLLPAILYGNRIAVRVVPNGTVSADLRFDPLCGVIAVGRQRVQSGLFNAKEDFDCGAFALHLVCHILLALFQKHPVQRFHALHFGNGDAEIPPAEAYQALYKPLLVA